MYVLKRTDQGGGYVARPGMRHSYTLKTDDMQTFPTREAAEAARCPENEIVVDVSELFTADWQ